MKRLLFTILLFTAALPAAAQLYHPGEQLFYRVSYKAKMFPNTEVGAVEVKTSEVQLDDRKFYKVEGIGPRCPPTAGSSTSKTSTRYGSAPRRCARYVSKVTSRRATTRSRAITPTTGTTARCIPGGGGANGLSRRKPCP